MFQTARSSRIMTTANFKGGLQPVGILSPLIPFPFSIFPFPFSLFHLPFLPLSFFSFFLSFFRNAQMPVRSSNALRTFRADLFRLSANVLCASPLNVCIPLTSPALRRKTSAFHRRPLYPAVKSLHSVALFPSYKKSPVRKTIVLRTGLSMPYSFRAFFFTNFEHSFLVLWFHGFCPLFRVRALLSDGFALNTKPRYCSCRRECHDRNAI